MKRHLLASCLLIVSVAADAQQARDPASRIAAQTEAMKPLAMMHGRWRGQAWTLVPAADAKMVRHQIVQTERIGPFLDGSVIVIEGRGYGADGRVTFNALGVIAYDPATKTYSMQSNAMGFAGTFPLRLIENGYVWEVPAGPGAVIRYTASINGPKWREIGERVMGTAPPVQIFEMNLVRLGDTAWPAADPVPMND
jgi:hypothetical protein